MVIWEDSSKLLFRLYDLGTGSWIGNVTSFEKGNYAGVTALLDGSGDYYFTYADVSNKVYTCMRAGVSVGHVGAWEK